MRQITDERDQLDEQLLEIIKMLAKVLEQLPDDTPVQVIICALGNSIGRVFDIVLDQREKRHLYDWMMSTFRITIGDKIADDRPQFNGH